MGAASTASKALDTEGQHELGYLWDSSPFLISPLPCKKFCLVNVSEPFRTHVFSCLHESEKTRSPLLPSAQREQERDRSPTWAQFCHGEVVAGRACPGPRRVRLREGCPTRPTPQFLRPAGASGNPTFPAPVGRARELPFRADTQTPKRQPRRGLWDSRGLSGSRGPLPGRLPAPQGLRVGASHGSELAP